MKRSLRDQRLNDGIINTVVSVIPGSTNRPLLAETSTKPICLVHQSGIRVDIALLVSALFLPRFSLPFGATRLQLELVAIGLLLAYQFLAGKLLIQFDRFLWFLGFAFAITCSLLLNFKSTMLTGYLQFLIFNSLFMLRRSSNPDQYKETLRAFQFIVLLLSCLGVTQFV